MLRSTWVPRQRFFVLGEFGFRRPHVRTKESVPTPIEAPSKLVAMDLGVFHTVSIFMVSMLPAHTVTAHVASAHSLTFTHSLTHHSPHSPGFVRSLGFRPIRAHLVGRFRCMLTTDASPGPLPRPARTKCRTHTLDFVSSISSFYSATRRMVRRRQSCFLSPSARRCSGPWVASLRHSVPKWIAYGPGAPGG